MFQSPLPVSLSPCLFQAGRLYQGCLTVASIVSVEFRKHCIRKREMKPQFLPPANQSAACCFPLRTDLRGCLCRERIIALGSSTMSGT